MVVVGSGIRGSKIAIDGAALTALANAEAVWWRTAPDMVG